MAVPPTGYFRKEDFPELADEQWAQRLFTRLNSMARQTQYGLDKNLTIENNLAAFWWNGTIGAYTRDASITYPYTEASPPAPTTQNASSIKAFPFDFKNTLTTNRIGAVIVGQAYDVTNTSKSPIPALVGGVAWGVESDRIKIFAINGMLPDRSYRVKLLILGE